MRKSLFIVLIFGLVMFFSCQKEEKDVTPPVITLSGYNPTYVNLDSTYVEPGYKAIDDVDGDITSDVVVTGTVDVHTEGNYILYYNVSDKSANAAEQQSREVKVLKF